MIDVLVPVLGRPQNAEPMAQSLAESTVEPYRLLFICSPGDEEEIRVCKELGEVLVVDWPPGRADFAKKINWVFDKIDSEWIFQGADDIRFSLRWDTEALQKARLKRVSVIGTNDLHNPAVKQRRHSTHTLFRRDYIEQHGGTYDGTGRVFCELYDHQFVDTEFVETAMLRKQWAFAQRSIVEHLHPYWGLSPYDSTYTKALRESGPDMQIYKSRCRVWNFNRRHARRR